MGFEIFADKVGDPKELTQLFRQVVEKFFPVRPEYAGARKTLEDFIKTPEELQDKKEEYKAASRIASEAWWYAVRASAAFSRVGEPLFLSILKTYTLPQALRKKVEMAARFFSKKPRFTSKKYGLERDLEKLDLYDKWEKSSREYLSLAEQTLTYKEHQEGETKIKAGPFTLVNTGGFSPKVMQEVADLAHRAVTLATHSGVGQVCYGDIQVTNTLARSNVAAFYYIDKDEVFVRANIKDVTQTIYTLLHELGHRYVRKFLRGNLQSQLDRLYAHVRQQESERVREREKSLEKPKPGEIFVDNGETYKVIAVTINRKGKYEVKLVLEGDPHRGGTISLQGYHNKKTNTNTRPKSFLEDPEFKGFVTEYSKSNREENFCEMFAIYCLGELPVHQSVFFEELLFGVPKTASFRQAHRIAARWLVEA